MTAVTPSFLEMVPADSRASWATRVNNDDRLRVGTVVQAYDPRDDKNFSKVAYEYDVEVMASTGQEQATRVIYRRCRFQTVFGGLADKCIWTPRIQVKNKDGSIKEPGTQVLLECVNGISRQAVIIGGIEPEDAEEQSQDFKEGVRLQWQFNGVDIVIDKDGQLTLTRMGPTNSEGKPKDDNDQNVGAGVTIDKDGVITVTAPKGVVIKVDDGQVETQASKGVKLGGDQKLILGDKYTDAEDAFLTDLQGKLSQLVGYVTGLASIVAAITTFTPGAPASALAAPLGALSASLPATFTQFKTKLKTQVLSSKNTTE